MHAVDARVVVAKALAADKFAAWCVELPPGCLVALEACGGAHHWARKLRGYGLVRGRLQATLSRPTAWPARDARTVRPMPQRSARRQPARTCASCR